MQENLIIHNLFCTVGQAMEILQIPRSAVHNLISNNKLPAVKLGKIFLLDKEAVILHALSPKRQFAKREASRLYLEAHKMTIPQINTTLQAETLCQ